MSILKFNFTSIASAWSEFECKYETFAYFILWTTKESTIS